MRLVPDQEERDLAATLRRLLAAECPIDLVRELREPGGRDDPALRTPLWRALASTGALGLGLPEEYGGSGGSLTDVGVLFQETGRALGPTAIHATVLAGLAIDRLGDPAQRARLLPGLCDGSACATTALRRPRDAFDVTPTLTATPAVDGGWCVDGELDFVSDADVADLVVTSAATPDGRVLALLVDRRAPGVAVEPLPTMGGHPLSSVVLTGVEVAPDAVLGGDRAPSTTDLRWLAQAAVALTSLDLVGVAEAALQRTVDHTLQRHQFGRPIASFQAAQHLVADVHIAVAAARLAALAAVSLLAGGELATRETAVARMHAAAAAVRATLDAHQLHGGMGYVVETDLHLWSERARVLSTLGGGADIAAGWLEEARR